MYYTIGPHGLALMRIDELYWDDDNVDHLFASHYVTPDEVEEALLGHDGEQSHYAVRRVGKLYEFLGETQSGRLLRMIGELRAGGRLRIFHARDMESRERRKFRKREGEVRPCRRRRKGLVKGADASATA